MSSLEEGGTMNMETSTAVEEDDKTDPVGLVVSSTSEKSPPAMNLVMSSKDLDTGASQVSLEAEQVPEAADKSNDGKKVNVGGDDDNGGSGVEKTADSLNDDNAGSGVEITAVSQNADNAGSGCKNSTESQNLAAQVTEDFVPEDDICKDNTGKAAEIKERKEVDYEPRIEIPATPSQPKCDRESSEPPCKIVKLTKPEVSVTTPSSPSAAAAGDDSNDKTVNMNVMGGISGEPMKSLLEEESLDPPPTAANIASTLPERTEKQFTSSDLSLSESIITSTEMNTTVISLKESSSATARLIPEPIPSSSTFEAIDIPLSIPQSSSSSNPLPVEILSSSISTAAVGSSVMESLASNVVESSTAEIASPSPDVNKPLSTAKIIGTTSTTCSSSSTCTDSGSTKTTHPLYGRAFKSTAAPRRSPSAYKPPPVMGTSMSSVPMVGIDLGTTSSSAVYHDGTTPFRHVQFENGGKWTKILESVVSFPKTAKDGDGGMSLILYGAEAVAQLTTDNASNTVNESKRLMGRNVDTVVRLLKNKVHYRIVKVNNKPMIYVKDGGKDKLLFPEQIAGMILRQIKKAFLNQTGKKMHSVVITVPAYFNNSQRSATVRAASLANLNVVQILNEPTAAAISFGHQLEEKKGTFKVLVFDFGGGTFDVSVVQIVKHDQTNIHYTVLKIAGLNYLGGQDLTFQLFKRLEAVANKLGMKLDKLALDNLRAAAEEAKIKLSKQDKAAIEIENLCDGKDFQHVVSREEFNRMNKSNFNAAIAELDKLFAVPNEEHAQVGGNSKKGKKDNEPTSSKKDKLNLPKEHEVTVKKEDITHVLLTGGSTQVREIFNLVKAYFSGLAVKPKIVQLENRYDVVRGAGIMAAQLNKIDGYEGIKLQDCVPYNIGLKGHDGYMVDMVYRNSAIPVRGYATHYLPTKRMEFYTVEIYEGNHVKASKNQFLSSFQVADAAIKSRNKSIEITVRILKTTGEIEILVFDGDMSQPDAIAQLTIRHNEKEQEQLNYERMKKDMDYEKVRIEKDKIIKTLKNNVKIINYVQKKDDDKYDMASMRYEMAVDGIISNLYGPSSFTIKELQMYKERMDSIYNKIIAGNYDAINYDGLPRSSDYTVLPMIDKNLVFEEIQDEEETKEGTKDNPIEVKDDDPVKVKGKVKDEDDRTSDSSDENTSSESSDDDTSTDYSGDDDTPGQQVFKSPDDGDWNMMDSNKHFME